MSERGMTETTTFPPSSPDLPRPQAGLAWLAAVVMVASLAACGGNDEGRTVVPDTGEFGGFADTNATTDDTAPLEDSSETAPPKKTGLEIVVLHDTSVPIQVGIQDTLILRAKVIDYEAGQPAAGALITYEILDSTGGGDAAFSAKTAYTNDDGEVENVFNAGNAGDVNYTVKLSTEGAEDKLVDFIVSDTPKGSIEVHFDYEGPISINTVKVRLMPKGYICGQFKPTANISGSLADKTVLDIGDTPVFDGLSAGSHFTLVATAKSPTGALAAAGCNDGVFVVADQKTPATLVLHLLPLNPTGSYDVDNRFDFTNALGELGTVGTVVQGIVELFDNPGGFLLDQIKSLVSLVIPEWVTDIAFSLFEDQLADVINDWVKNDSPEWVQDFFTIGQDITQIVDNLNMLSTLKISKLHNDYYFQGTQYWTGIVLWWKFGCDPEDPGYDECGKLQFTLSDLANTQFPQDIIEGQFTGTIANYDKMFIDQHTIQISYGKLILFVLNEVLLPALTGENTMKDAVLKAVNCPGIASALENSVLDGIGISEQDIDDFCTSTVGLLISPLETYIGGLALDSQLRLSGQCTLVDENDDLFIDSLIDGTYSGEIDINQGAGPTFSGTFEGTKQALPSSPGQ